MTATISRPAISSPSPIEDAPDATSSRPGGSNLSAATDPPMPITTSPQGSSTPDPIAKPRPPTGPPSLLDPALCLAADVVDDLERVRIANENRLRQLTRTEVDADGGERGFGLPLNHPDVARLAAMVAALKQLEHDAVLELQRKMRKHPLGVWVAGQRGVGEKQGARLLAAIGDPYINSAKDAPRTVSALWAYCGLHVLPGGHQWSDAHSGNAAGAQHRDTDHTHRSNQIQAVGVAAKRRKGERANWSGKAKMRAYLIAESCIKQLDPQCRGGHPVAATQTGVAVPACACSPYRVVYDERRGHTAVTHPEWTDGHSHNDALRVASKAILRDLWRAARDWHNR